MSFWTPPAIGTDGYNNLPLVLRNQIARGASNYATEQSDNEASAVATDNAAALQALVGADLANNTATGAITGGDVTGPGVATLGGDPVPTTTATPWTTYALYVALAFGGWYFWKKHRKQK